MDKLIYINFRRYGYNLCVFVTNKQMKVLWFDLQFVLEGGSVDLQTKHVPSTIKDQIKLVLIEIKPLRPSLKIKFIKVHSKEVKSTNLIEMQVNRPSFKYKLKIE